MKYSTAMMGSAATLLLVVLVTAAGILPKGHPAHAEANPEPGDLPGSHILEEPIRPLPEQSDLDPQKVALGHRLFQDRRLSHDNTISCASCHDLSKGGTDQSTYSIGIGGAVGGINAPTVLNSGLNYKQFWNGRAATLEDQVNGPTHNPKEMGSNWPEIIGKLKSDPQEVAAFQMAYQNGISPNSVRDAIATYERSLTTPDSPFDRYLRGDQSALDAETIKGYACFKRDGCISCHQGANIGGNLFQKFGVMGNYFADRGDETDADQGRYAVTKRACDMHVFRVPSLRNVALTAPYFHDGSASTLPQAVEVMAKYQLGRPLDPDELVAIVKFLNSLTGKQPEVKS